MKSRIVFSLVTALACLFMAGCSKSPKDLIIGKWQMPKDEGTVEFTKEGECKMVMGPLNITGKYTFPEEKKVKIEVSMMGETQTQLLTIESVTNDLLVTIDEKGKRDELKRAK